MTISNEHSQNPSRPEQHNAEQPELSPELSPDDTLRIIPRRPLTQSQPAAPEIPPANRDLSAPRRQMPDAQASADALISPLTGQSVAPLAPGAGVLPDNSNGVYRQAAAIGHPRRPGDRGRKAGIFVVLGLLLLVIIVVATSLLTQLVSSPTAQGRAIPQPSLGNGSGPYIGQPFTPAQINALRHRAVTMTDKQLASLYVSRMSLDEELGQLIMVEYSDTTYSSDLNTMITKLHAGGVIMYEFQMNTFNQTKHDIAQMQLHAKIPLLISTDEEGGPYVRRLENIYPPRPSAWDVYQSGKVSFATSQGHLMAHDLLALGINEDLAPDVDVMLVPGYDTVTRTFGTTPQSVITYAGAYMQAMQQDGLIACIKHYPGLGATVLDAHKTLPVINRTKAQIYSTELAPYKAFVQTQNKLQNPGMIMSTDLLMPAIDPTYPAELSHTFITDILRNQLGYNGVVITDALYMQGILEKWSMPEAAVLALNAGVDMLLGPNGAAQTLAMINGLKAALQDGRLSRARVDEAATRIIALKLQYHLMPDVPPQD